MTKTTKQKSRRQKHEAECDDGVRVKTENTLRLSECQIISLVYSAASNPNYENLLEKNEILRIKLKYIKKI